MRPPLAAETSWGFTNKKEEIINYLKKYDYELIDCKKIKSLTMFSNLFAEDCYFKKINI